MIPTKVTPTTSAQPGDATEMVQVELNRVVSNDSNYAAPENSIDLVDEEVGPIEDRMVKETVVTIDTTDKRSHRVARAQHTYAAKKTVAQGMMDVALITANANQLRYLVEYQRNSPTFFVNVFLIVVSLLLQIAVGVSLIFKGRYDIRGKGKSPQALKINNYVVVAVFLITIINVFVASFSVSSSPVSLRPASSVQRLPP
ncbi:ninjurin-A-like [Venturia canescens]|uniref:ninjurin-A-like n=1 Tax=Venturia canescens TaxID=32260 RepID=UPI001C9BD061|nr:ninjurin-A-like [Venturia canescens]